MAPETTTSTSGRVLPSGQTVHVPVPDSGQEIAVDSSPAGLLELAFDPSEATATREDNSLVFTLDDGGKVVITDFFVVGDESLPTLKLPDGVEVASLDFFEGSDLDMTTAAGPTSPASGGGDDGINVAAMTGGLSKSGKLGTDQWGHENEVDEEVRGETAPMLNFFLDAGLGEGGMSTRVENVNESESNAYLRLNFDKPLVGEITLVFQVGGTAKSVNDLGAANEFRSDYQLPEGDFGGYKVSYDPATGELSVTLPDGSLGADIPIALIDDHINDGAKNITFELKEVQGNASGQIGSQTIINISEDNRADHVHGGDELAVLDGPIVGAQVKPGTTDTHYEGEGKDSNTFTVNVTLTDPHSDNPYEGFVNSNGDALGYLSQDMSLTLGVASGNTANYGEDFEFDLSPLYKVAGDPSSGWIDGVKSVIDNGDGTVTIELYGMVDANGNVNAPGLAFDLTKTDDLNVNVKVLINNDSAAGEIDGGEEGFSIIVTGTQGNESQPAGDNASADFTITEDPKLTLDIAVDAVAESGAPYSTFAVTLKFVNKDIGDDVEFKATLTLGDDNTATLWDGSADSAFRADYFLPGTEFDADGKPIAAYDAAGNLTTTAGGVTYTYDADTGTITVSGKGSDFDASNELDITFIVNDDHIGGSADLGDFGEKISLGITDVTLDDGYSGHNHASGGGVSWDGTPDRIIIADDTEAAANLDGPVVGLTFSDGTAPVNMTEGDVKQISITLKDPSDTSKNYTDYKGETQLSQDMVLTFTVEGMTGATDAIGNSASGEYGADFTLTFTQAMIDLFQAKYGIDLTELYADGKNYIELDADGAFTLTLPGRVGENGALNSATPFDLNDLDQLVLEMTVLTDDLTERTDSTISISVSTNGGNESTSAGGTLDVTIIDDLTGPVLSLSGTTSVRESQADTEGGYDKFAPEHNTASYTIDLSKPAAEAITARVTFSPTTGTEMGGDDADFTFNGSFVVTLDDGSTVTLTLGNGVTDKGNGVYEIEIPADAVKVEFETTIVDDLRENEGAEGYQVSLDLVYTDASGAEKTPAEGGKADSEASIQPGAGSVGTVITEDVRGGTTNLNPADFDGPFVGVENVGQESLQESAGESFAFKVALKSPDGAGNVYEADEAISVTLQIGAASGDAGLGFTLSDLFKPSASGDISGSITVTYYADDGTTVVGTQTVTLTGKAWDTSGSITLTLPEGAASASFSVPVNDDPLGAVDAINSVLENGSEAFVINITNLEGNEARVDDAGFGKSSSAGGTIIDDSPDDGAISGNENALEGIGLSLGWNYPSDVHGGKSVKEGTWPGFKLKVTLPDGGDPYAGYTQQGGLPEELRIAMKLTDNTAGDDFQLKLGADLKAAILAGDVTIEYIDATTGLTVTLDSTMSAAQLNSWFLDNVQDGRFTVVVSAGTPVADIPNYEFVIRALADNVNEWDKDHKYEDYQGGSEDAARQQESFEVKIESVTGNESYVAAPSTDDKTSNVLTGEITDMADGALSWASVGTDPGTGDPLDSGSFADGAWHYKVNVSYGDAESATAGGIPGETVTMQIKITDSAAMQNGADQEYVVNAYTLFLSLNSGVTIGGASLETLLKDAYGENPGITDEASYLAHINAALAMIAEDYPDEVAGIILVNTTSDAYSRFIALNGDLIIGGMRLEDLLKDAHGENPGITDEATFQAHIDTALAMIAEAYPAEAAQIVRTDGEYIYELTIPEGAWDADGNISFDIDQGANTGVSSALPGFTVEMVDPYNGDSSSVPDFDMKGEIVETGGAVSAETGTERITMNLSGGGTIYEDPNTITTGGNAPTHTEYVVHFANSAVAAGSWRAAGDITFDLTLSPRSAGFDTNTKDNYVTDADGNKIPVDSKVGDFAVCDENGTPFEYANLDELKAALNEWLTPADPDAPRATVTDIYLNPATGQYVFKFTVDEGYDLSQGVKINFAALDDSISDDNEKFGLILSGIDSVTGDTESTLNIGLGKDNKHDTVIRDESTLNESARNGFAIAVGNGEGLEAHGSHNIIAVPVFAYIIDDVTSLPMSLESLVNAYNALNAGDPSFTPISVADAAASAGFKGFVNDHYKPVEDITIRYGLSDGAAGHDGKDAEKGKDYMNKTSDVVKSDEWELEIKDGQIYYKTKDGSGIKVETIADNLDEGDEYLTVTVTGTSGNESRPISNADKTEIGDDTLNVGKSEVIIHDYVEGPNVVGFVTNYVVEPVAPGGRFPAPGEDPLTKTATYTIQLDNAAEEPVMVWMDLRQGADCAELGKDFVLGENIFECRLEGGEYKVYSFDGKGGETCEGTLEEFWNAQGYSDYAHADSHYLDPKEGYFTVIPKDATEVSFGVEILHDNDTANERGEDLAGKEQLVFDITETQGSEVRVDGNVPSTLPDGSLPQIQDDGYGPSVGLTPTGDGHTYTVTIGAPASEDVKVTVTVINARNGSSMDLEVTIPAGETTASVDINQAYFNLLPDWAKAIVEAMPDRLADFIGKIVGRPDSWVSVDGVNGGEAHSDGAMHFANGQGIGGNLPVPVRITHLESTDITEGALPGEAGSPVQYEMHLDVTDAYLGVGDVSFELQVVNASTDNSDLNVNGGDSIKVNLSPEAVLAIKAAGGDIEIRDEGDGPKVYLKGSDTPLNGADVTGDMPAALGDNKVEGNEHFNTIIVNPSGNTDLNLDADSDFSTTVKDNTHVRLFFVDDEGNILTTLSDFTEGQGKSDLTVMLYRTDEDGNLVLGADGKPIPATADDPIELNVTYTGSGAYPATQGEDFTGDNIIRIPAGSSGGTIHLHFPEDQITENDEKFTISIGMSDETKDLFGHMPGALGVGADGEVLDATATIRENENWMDIKFEMPKEVTEGGSITIDISSWNGGIRQVVAEEVECTFTLTPKPGFNFGIDPATGLSDIESITVDGVTYAHNPIDPQKPFSDIWGPKGPLTYNEGDGTFSLKVVMDSHSALDKVVIKTYNDTITESGEGFTVKLESVHGSEARPYTDAVSDVTVKDDMNGYKLNVTPDTSSNEEDGASVILSFSGSNAPQEAVDVTIKLDADALKILDAGAMPGNAAGDPVGLVVTLPDGTLLGADKMVYDAESGKLVLTLPKGMSPGDVKVTFPVLDNSTVGDQNFGMTVEVKGGEMSMAGLPSFSSEFQGEQSPVGANGGYSEFSLSAPEGSTAGVKNGALVLTVTGVKASVVGSITVGDTEYGPDQWTVNGDGSITLNVGGKLVEDYDIFINYVKATDDNRADISSSKANVGVSASVTGDAGTNVVVKDESGPDAVLEGPSAGVEITSLVPVDPADPDGPQQPGITEGGALTGNVVITMAGAPGDNYSQGTVEDMVVTITVSRDGALGAFAVEAPFEVIGPDHPGYDASAPAGSIQIFIPKGTDITGGKVDIPFTQSVPDDNLVNNPAVTVTVNDLAGLGGEDEPRYETHGVGSNAAAQGTIIDGADLSGPVVGLNFTATAAAEGADTALGSLVITLPGSDVEAGFTVTLTVPPGYTSVTVGGVEYLVNQDGDSIELPIAPGTPVSGGAITLDVSATAKNDYLISDRPAGDFSVSISGGDYETHSVADGKGSASVTIVDETEGQGPVGALELSGTAVEGGADSALGNLVLTLPAGNTELLEPITVTVTAPAGFDSISIGGQSGTSVTITLDPADYADVPGGKISLPVTGTATDNAVLEADRTVNADGFTVEVKRGSDDPADHRYESVKTGANSGSVTITDDPGSLDGVAWSFGAAAGAPGAVTYNLDFSRYGNGGVDLGTLAAATFTLTGFGVWADEIAETLKLDGSVQNATADGNGVISVTLNPGLSPEGGFSFEVDDSVAAGREISIGNVQLTSSLGAYEHVEAGNAAVTWQPEGWQAGDTAEGRVIYGSDEQNTLHGSDHGDLIYGGGGDDVIYAKGLEGTETTVHGGEGNDQIFAGLGDDLLFGDAGNDTFVWTRENLGGEDTIKDFDFKGTWVQNEETGEYTFTADAGADRDQIQFGDIFGDQTSVETVLSGSVLGEGNSFTFSDGSRSITATFNDTATSIELTVSDGEQELQSITVENNGGAFYDAAQTDLDAGLAQAILEQIIKDYSV